MFLSVENIATLTSQKFISREAFAKDYPVYPKHGDVLMTRIGDIGTSNVVETDDKLAFYVSLALLKPFDVDSYYLDKSLQSPSAKEELYRRTLHIAFPKKINKNQIAEVMLPIPRSRQEQEQIGALFRDLDSLITLHQRKYDKFVQLKKSMLDKMFPKPGERFPEIRFAGFTDPWEQRKLGDVATIVGGGTPSTNNDAYWDGDIDWYSPAELGEQVYADRSVRRITQAGYDSCSATLLPAGKTILFTSRAGIGNTAILRRSACTNQGFQSLVVNDDTDVYFIYSMTDRIKKFAEQKASGSTFLEISGKGLAAGEFVFPSKEEQTAIGSMFKQLDHLITLHQCKRRKESFSRHPVWEQRKFADFVTASGIRNSENLDLPSYSVTNDRGFVPQDEQFENGGTMREADKTSYWIVEPNSFAYNPARINVGSIGYQSTRGNVIVSSLYEVFRTDETCDDHFLWHWFKTRLFTQQIEMLQEGGVRLYFFFDKLLKSGISMPSVDEQRLIGEQFDWLNSLITLHQREPQFTDMGYMRVERALMTMSMSLFSSS